MTKQFDTKATEVLVGSMEEATKNTIPFIGKGEKDNIVVVGDVNNIDTESDYYATFIYPKNYAINGDFKETPEGKEVVRLFSKVEITPKKARRLRHAVSTLILYFSKINKVDKSQDFITMVDFADMYGTLSDEIVEAMESVVQHTLGISDFDMEYLTDESLLDNVTLIVKNNSGFFQRNTK